jgi:outer membrane receptor protein involved in Fe transport
VAANTSSLPAYATGDATVRWRPNARDELSMELRNLLNTPYETSINYPVPRFELRLGASHQF